MPEYKSLVEEIAGTIRAGRSRAAWSLNAVMSAVYWEIGRQIVVFEQKGKATAEYGEQLMALLSLDLEARFGRGFRKSNLFQFRRFYFVYADISQTPSGKSVSNHLLNLVPAFTLPWSHYVRLLSIKSEHARKFYQEEALRGGWSFRELDRQISAQLYERLALSRNKGALLRQAEKARQPGTPEEELREPYILEFLNLKDAYSESDLEEALIRHLEQFLIELGNDFCFVGRQRRLRIGGEWYRVDLLFFHRKLRYLVIIELKVGKFTHADVGQMHLYCNYAREHWTQADENPPVGLILCAEKDDAVARYALEGLPNKILAREYNLTVPNEDQLAAEIEKTRERLEAGRGRKLLRAGRVKA